MKLKKQTQIKVFLITVLAVFSMSSIAGILESSDNNKIKYINGYTVWNGSVEDYIPDVKQFEKRLSNWTKCANKPGNNIEYLNCTNRTQFILDNSMPGYFGSVSVWDLNRSEHLQPLRKIILNRVTAASCGLNRRKTGLKKWNWGKGSSGSANCKLVMVDKAEEFAQSYIMWDNKNYSMDFVIALEGIKESKIHDKVVYFRNISEQQRKDRDYVVDAIAAANKTSNMDVFLQTIDGINNLRGLSQ